MYGGVIVSDKDVILQEIVIRRILDADGNRSSRPHTRRTSRSWTLWGCLRQPNGSCFICKANTPGEINENTVDYRAGGSLACCASPG